jgi:hypothetical protein
VKALADPSMAQVDTEGLSRQDDPSPGGSDGQLFAVGIVVVGRSDQLVMAEAVTFMIDERAGCRTDAQSNRDEKIRLGVDIAASVGDRPSEIIGGQADGAGRVMSCGRPALKVRRKCDVVRHQHRGAYA